MKNRGQLGGFADFAANGIAVGALIARPKGASKDKLRTLVIPVSFFLI
jgi:hypothetical protein